MQLLVLGLPAGGRRLGNRRIGLARFSRLEDWRLGFPRLGFRLAHAHWKTRCGKETLQGEFYDQGDNVRKEY
jgi:hypothetical protein